MIIFEADESFTNESRNYHIEKSVVTCQDDGLQFLELDAAIGSAGQLVALTLDLIHYSIGWFQFVDPGSKIQGPGSRIPI